MITNGDFDKKGVFIVMVQFGQRYGSNDEELGYRKENINE